MNLIENYEDAGIRKAILLARYIDYLKDNLPSSNYDQNNKSIDRKTIKELLNKLTIEYELSNKSDE